MVYGDTFRYTNHRLWLYRQGRHDFRDPEENPDDRGWWTKAILPMRAPPRIFMPGIKSPMLNRVKKPTRERWQKYETRIKLVRSWFGVMPHTRFQLRRNLGAGGQGLAVQLKYTDPDVYPEGRDFVLKTSVDGWESRCLRREEDWALKMRRNAHIVQSIDAEELGLPPRRKFEVDELGCDQDSSEEESSGTGSEREKYPPRRKPTRREINAHPEILEQRRVRKQARRQAARRRYDDRKMRMIQIRESRLRRYIQGESLPPLSEEDPDDNMDLRRLDYLLLEYMENGDLYQFIQRMQESDRKMIPNRVLWAFWLCLVRSCVAMAYPVNKFHPDRHAPRAVPPEDQIRKGLKRELKGLHAPLGRGDSDQDPQKRELLEEIPRPQMRNREKPIVHFDIDPQNILIGPVEVPEADVCQWRATLMQKRLNDELEELELNRSKLQLDQAMIPARYGAGPISALPLNNTEGAPNTMENRLSAISLTLGAQNPDRPVPEKDAILQSMEADTFDEQFQSFTEYLDQSEMGRIGDADLDRVTLALLLVGRAQGQSICLCVARGVEAVYAYPAPSKTKGKLEGIDGLISQESQDGQVFYLALQEVKDGHGWEKQQKQGDGGLPPREYEDVAIGMDPNPFRHPGAGVIADPGGLLRRIVPTAKHAEHALTPRLKLADFGLAQLSKPQKRNSFYNKHRMTGKTGYLAPEQFCEEWETIPDDPDGAEVSEASVAGQYGSATNVWGIALTMWQVITGYHATMPPWPQDPAHVEWVDDDNAAAATSGPTSPPSLPRDDSECSPGLRGGSRRPPPEPPLPDRGRGRPQAPARPQTSGWPPQPARRPLSPTTRPADPAQLQAGAFPRLQPGYLPARHIGTLRPIGDGMVPAPLFAGQQYGNQPQWENQPQYGNQPPFANLLPKWLQPQIGNQAGTGIYDEGGGVRTPPLRPPRHGGPQWAAGFSGPAGPRPPPPRPARRNTKDRPNTKISYCSLLLDPEHRKKYRWVDRDLRRTIYQCMYHRPKDRPSLHALLAQAKQGAAKSFPGESDDMIRAWVADLFHNPIGKSDVGP